MGLGRVFWEFGLGFAVLDCTLDLGVLYIYIGLEFGLWSLGFKFVAVVFPSKSALTRIQAKCRLYIIIGYVTIGLAIPETLKIHNPSIYASTPELSSTPSFWEAVENRPMYSETF